MSTPNNEPNNPYSSDRQDSYRQNPAYQAPQYQGQNQQYGQQYGQQQPGYGYPGYPMMNPEGAQLAQTSLIFGILSLFMLGLIFGPIAIVKANRAEREFNTSATVGKVTGWIGTILAGITVLLFIFFVIISLSVGAASYESF
ncbi:DUF4190 domain-containing protein [Glutamicibacter sp.]|uniref:DUF4190 domain-containing protein n=1 Tax=Glutamicibacter sp. TaxID=1931995 RepID=UPI0028BED5BA|nr:DUF4190 domain-containing protein [Glutamicibacter sp.]